MLGTVPVAVTAKDALRAAPPAMMVSAYFNVADKHYISRSDIASVLAYIENLECKLSALEVYLDGPIRTARCGLPVTKRPA
jgi:hypothetical protein